MKANLQSAEPQALARWREMNLYRLIREHRKGAPRFVLHDGPPYANGRIHIGHAMNKVLKDFIVKARVMAGFDAPYVPGWDCHGLPIELQVDRELGPRKRGMSISDFRRDCRAYAERFIAVQRADFERLEVFGDWSAPYLTMNYAYQAAIVRALGTFVARKMVYKGKKPVHWCIHCRTALAEAEVEYENHASPSIYVEFPPAPEQSTELAKRVPALAGRPASVLIWTTTPWTIPSNLAIAFHPELEYAAYEVDGTVVIVAEALAGRVSDATGRRLGAPLARFAGRTLEGLRFRHPLYARDSPAVLGDYVTLDQGTGAVHTAPGHGADDFGTGIQYGLEIYAPVGSTGHFLDSVERFGGMRVFDANPHIQQALAESGRLWKHDVFEHSYPHCWRCHNPVIFLATSQWFIAMEAGDLRSGALDAIMRVAWVPPWGEARISGMIANRPDWCISRQRSWGVPIPAVECNHCKEAVLTPELIERAAAVFETRGADAWYEEPIEGFLPPGLTCPSCGGAAFEQEKDILDVWFDSGSSHRAVLRTHPGLGWPADLYLEGSDQYRGWFQSSLLVGVGVDGTAPYRQVLTHGFVVDEDGRKMSKSLGTGVEPQDIIEQSGAEILRLWVCMVDYREDVRLGKEVMARVIEAYRKIRNTCRILAANLFDFDPDRDSVPLEQMQEIDRYALARYAEAAARMIRAYDQYEFPVIFQTLNALLTIDISAFYVDVSKDRLYTFKAVSLARRSAQTAMFRIVDGLTRLVAPVLSVTADDLWRYLPGSREASVHLADFPSREELRSYIDLELVETWGTLIEARDAVNAAIEPLRKSKVLGNSLQASVRLTAGGVDLSLLERYRIELPAIFMVADVRLEPDGAPDAGERQRFRVDVTRAAGEKCERCWRVVPSVSPEPDRRICGRCEEALA